MANSGKSNPGNFANDREKAARAGHTGGTHQGAENNPGIFANDREKAAEAGRSGGQASHGGQSSHGGLGHGWEPRRRQRRPGQFRQ